VNYTEAAAAVAGNQTWFYRFTYTSTVALRYNTRVMSSSTV